MLNWIQNRISVFWPFDSLTFGTAGPFTLPVRQSWWWYNMPMKSTIEYALKSLFYLNISFTHALENLNLHHSLLGSKAARVIYFSKRKRYGLALMFTWIPSLWSEASTYTVINFYGRLRQVIRLLSLIVSILRQVINVSIFFEVDIAYLNIINIQPVLRIYLDEKPVLLWWFVSFF